MIIVLSVLTIDLMVIVLSVLFWWSLCCLSFSDGQTLCCLSFSNGHCVVCPFLTQWSLCCLSFSDDQKRTDNTMIIRKGQTTQWSSEKDRQHNDHQKRTDNTMTIRKGQTTQWPSEKDRQHNDHQKRTDDHDHWKGQIIVLTMIIRKGQTTQWSLKRTDNTMTIRKGQTTQWPSEKDIVLTVLFWWSLWKGQTFSMIIEKDRQHNDH